MELRHGKFDEPYLTKTTNNVQVLEVTLLQRIYELQS